MAEKDPRSDFEFLARDAEWKAARATALHVAALWREFAANYREVADYCRSTAPANAGPQRPDQRSVAIRSEQP